jgi:3-oxoacyl-[acyl-carrier protein] reductase
MSALSGRNFVITGGGGAIGQACAARLLASGAAVLLVDIDEKRLSLARHALGAGDKLGLHRSAIADPREAAKALDAVRGPVHGIVHMAGVFEWDRLDPADHDPWDRAIAANLTNAYDLCVAYQSRRDKEAVGRIVMASSLAFRRGAAGRAAYCAAKAGIVGLVRGLSKDFAPHTLVNAVAPGFIRTSMTEELAQTRGEAYMAQIPLGRFGTPEDVAGLVSFLCGPDSAYITGQTYNVDGGMWAS